MSLINQKWQFKSGAVYCEDLFICGTPCLTSNIDDTRINGESWLGMWARTAPLREEAKREEKQIGILIAAAPELLEAIESLIDKLGCFESDAKLLGTGWNSDMIDALHDAESAIAKAKGHD